MSLQVAPRRVAAQAGPQARTWPFAGMPLIPARSGPGGAGMIPATPESSMAHSAVWGCLRVRSDLVSTIPLDVFMSVDGLAVQVSTPMVLSLPGGERVDIVEWLASSQRDVDHVGNAVGLITKFDGYGLPQRIELQAHETVTVVVRDGRLKGYRIGGKFYVPELVWHEKAYTKSGMFVGLSPVAYAASSISQGLSASMFALQWFGDGGVPMGRLKNTAKTIDEPEALKVKTRFRNAVANRDVFVHGIDWDYQMIQADRNATEWIESNRASVLDVCRFYGVPSDLIDGETQSRGVIKYANVTQRILEFLIINLYPALVRRETALSRLLPARRQAIFRVDSILRMDPAVAAAMIQTKINSRVLTPDEAREAEGKPALTADQIDLFGTLFGTAQSPPSVMSGAQPPA